LSAQGGDKWQAVVPLTQAAEYLIQVVDLAGNVAVDDNQGRYYQIISRAIYLPIVLR
jgi:hypothetical protein